MKTFSQWYDSLPQSKKPYFEDYQNNVGNYRIVFSTEAELWNLSDYVVSSQMCGLVYLYPLRKNKHDKQRMG